MTLDRDKLQDAAKTYKAVFMEELLLRDDRWRLLVAEETATGKDVTQQWMGPAGTVREWDGDRQAEKFRGYNFTLENKRWETTVRVPRADLEDDALGQYAPAIRAAARGFELHRAKLAFQLLRNGFAATDGLAYDGQFFFDSDHQDDEETAQDNLITAVLGTAGYDEAVESMMQFTDSKGEYLDLYPTHLFAAPQNRAAVKKTFGNAHVLDDSGTNTIALENYNKGEVMPIIVPWLAASPNAWFVADLSRPDMKPLRYQKRIDPEWQALDDLDNEHTFFKDEFLYGGRARYNLGFGFWQCMVGSTGAG